MAAGIARVGRYELLVELARGGMAELYVARLTGVGGFQKLVVIKRILPHLAVDNAFVEMFLDEGRIAAQLAHPSICQIHELGEDRGELFLVMEYLEGVPWSALIERSRARSTAEQILRLTAGVLDQACEGLHHAHTLRGLDGEVTPVIHRDVSPQNLFVTVDGVCKVLDFGVSKMVKDGPRTRSGVLKGKLPYMSPEQIQGGRLDAGSDVFALGVVLWESLAGESLFDRDTDFLIGKAILEDPIPSLASRGAPPAADAVVEGALARDRERRFRDARAFGEALRRAAASVGGIYDVKEIAAVVREACGDEIAARQRRISRAVADGPAHVAAAAARPLPAAAATVAGSESIQVRRMSLPVGRRRPRRSYLVGLGGAVLAAAVLVIAVVSARHVTTAERAGGAVPTSADRAPAPVAEPPIVRRDEAEAEAEVRPAPAAEPPRAPSGRSRRATRSHVEPALAAEAGSLTVDSTPYATIYVDGEELGHTPLFRAPVAPGKHTVRAVRADGRQRTFQIEIASGKELKQGRLRW